MVGLEYPLDTYPVLAPPLGWDCPRGSSASSGQSERSAVPSCLLSDLLMVFVVLQLKDAPESGLDGLGDSLRYGGLGLLCVSPKISEDIANFSRESSRREAPRGQGCARWKLWRVGIRGDLASLGYSPVPAQTLYLNPRVKSLLHEAGAFVGSTLQSRKLRHREVNIPSSGEPGFRPRLLG